MKKLSNGNQKKYDQLEMPIGTAANKLRKLIMFSMVQELGRSICYRCNLEIKSVKNFSIEHKVAWMDSGKPIELYFDLDNIAFSHLGCNSRHRKKFLTRPHLCGEKIGISKLTDEKVLEIYRLRKKEKELRKV